MQPKPKRAIVDCDAGRRLGCHTFCCRLLVRLAPRERDPSSLKGMVDKAQDGVCVHFDRSTQRCANWDNAPAICRAYHCNDDPLLQVVLCEGFTSLVRLVTSPLQVPADESIRVPMMLIDDD